MLWLTGAAEVDEKQLPFADPSAHGELHQAAAEQRLAVCGLFSVSGSLAKPPLR